ncbi:MAG: hypothetical protein ACE37J_11105 [Pikeienuella sp.]|uniref:hypothetical protein n=1 Tax=Pikeienuella sp. TaxID=2831957 RepID=UPI00391957E9
MALASGNAHTLALTESGKVFAWGQNRQGRLGSPEGLDEDGAPLIRVASPVEVVGLPGDAQVVAVSAPTLTSHAVMSDGRVFGWSEGKSGQLLRGEDIGDGTFSPASESVSSPVELVGLPDNVIDVKGGARWAATLTADGDV